MIRCDTKMTMVTAVGVGLIFLSLFGQGSAIECYSCKDYTGSCTQTENCRLDDACLTLNERGGQKYRQCIKYSECDIIKLSVKFPKVASFNFDCCTQNLCNAATVTAVSSSMFTLLASLALVWWCLF